MAVNPGLRARPTPPCRLAPFDPAWAEVVISWVRDAREMYWLAPKSPPPLTVAEVLRWCKPGHYAYVLLEGTAPTLIAYGELNRLEGGWREYWLGHLIVDPLRRGQGYGVQLTTLLLHEAFEQRGARRVTLVVFPENEAARACYRAAGMHADGHEWHMFPAYGRREGLIRFVATRSP